MEYQIFYKWLNGNLEILRLLFLDFDLNNYQQQYYNYG